MNAYIQIQPTLKWRTLEKENYEAHKEVRGSFTAWLNNNEASRCDLLRACSLEKQNHEADNGDMIWCHDRLNKQLRTTGYKAAQPEDKQSKGVYSPVAMRPNNSYLVSLVLAMAKASLMHTVSSGEEENISGMSGSSAWSDNLWPFCA